MTLLHKIRKPTCIVTYSVKISISKCFYAFDRSEGIDKLLKRLSDIVKFENPTLPENIQDSDDTPPVTFKSGKPVIFQDPKVFTIYKKRRPKSECFVPAKISYRFRLKKHSIRKKKPIFIFSVPGSSFKPINLKDQIQRRKYKKRVNFQSFVRIDSTLILKANKSVKDIYGIYRCPKLPKMFRHLNKVTISPGEPCLIYFTLKDIKRKLFLHLLKNPTISLTDDENSKLRPNKLGSNLSKLDLAALYLLPQEIKNYPQADAKETNAILRVLKRKLMRHRKKRLGLIKRNHILTPESDFGNLVGELVFALNKYKRVTRSQRKKRTRCAKKRKILFKKQLQEQFIRQRQKEKDQEKNREIREVKTKERIESLAYLSIIRSCEKKFNGKPRYEIYGYDNSLDMLFTEYTQSDIDSRIKSIKRDEDYQNFTRKKP